MISGSSLKSRAIRYLARREHSRRELEQKLLRNAPATAVREELSSVLDSLEQDGHLSAERFVDAVVRNRKNRYGSRRILHELQKNGIAENLIAAAWPSIQQLEQDSAYDVWQKKFGIMPASAREYGRQQRFLMARGFSPNVIQQVLRQPLEKET